MAAHAKEPDGRFKDARVFGTWHYQRHNQRRQEHLASLVLDLCGKTVLEVGAGVGDHSSFFIDRGCEITITDGRQENVELLRDRFPHKDIRLLDLDSPDPSLQQTYQIVYCYGLLYHLAQPSEALEYLAERCSGLLLLETCVSFGEEEEINWVEEDTDSWTQATHKGCRPTRIWIFNQLRRHFEFVYVPLTQPNHDEFPVDWTQPPADRLNRAVFIGSRKKINSPVLLTELPDKQSNYWVLSA